MSKKIEPGCMVMVYGLVIDTDLNGMSGTVGKFLMAGSEHKGFIIEGPFSGWEVINKDFEDGWAHFHVRNLLRIDEYDASQDEVEEELTATQ